MSAAFFENFAVLTEAANGVAKLRELILRLAVVGKLTTQDPNDHPSPNLKNDGIIQPFSLPSGWSWAKLAQLGQWAIGSGFPKSAQGETDKPILFCKVSDMNLPGNEKFITATVNTIDDATARKMRAKAHSPGTVVFPKIGGAIATNKRRILVRPTAIDNNCLGIFPEDYCSSEWLYLLMRSIDLMKYQSGTSVPALSQGVIGEIITALPPLEEQRRIVARVDELMRLCDELEARQQSRHRSRMSLNNVTLAPLNNASLTPEEFGQAADRLANNFAALYDSAETVDLLRSTILQLAVQGKLVPQDPNEESAILLLKAIQEKRKKLVKSSELRKLDPTRAFDPDKLPLSLPKGWDWTQLGEISLKLGAGSTPLGGRSVYRNEGVKFLRSQNVWNDGLRLDGVAYITEETHEDMGGTQVEPGDVLLNITGASIGRSAIAPEDIGEANVSQHVSIIRLVDKRLRFFIHLCVISPYFQRSIMQTQVGISREGLSMRSLKEFVLPIPPLEEQNRIVAKVNQLVALCDELEAKLRKADSDSEKVMNAAVRNVLSSVTETPILTGAGLS